MRAIKIIQEFPSNRAGIKLMAEGIVSGVMSGDVDPLEVKAKLESIEKIIKEVKADISFRDAVQDEAEMHPDKTFELNGVKFTKSSSAKYDYSEDEVWGWLKEQEEGIANDRKKEEAMLKTLDGPTEVNGVMRTPPFKKSSSYVKITF